MVAVILAKAVDEGTRTFQDLERSMRLIKPLVDMRREGVCWFPDFRFLWALEEIRLLGRAGCQAGEAARGLRGLKEDCDADEV